MHECLRLRETTRESERNLSLAERLHRDRQHDRPLVIQRQQVPVIVEVARCHPVIVWTIEWGQALMGLTQHMQPPEFLEGSVDARIRRLRRHLDVLTRLRELQRIEQKIYFAL